MPKPATTSPAPAPELGGGPGNVAPATPTSASEGATKTDGIDPKEFRRFVETQNQLAENQKVMYAALQALGNQQYEVVPDAPAPQPETFQFPEVEGFEALAPVMNQVLAPMQAKLNAALEKNQRLEETIAATRRQDHWGFFKNSVPGWEKYDTQMGEICKQLGVQPQNAEQFRTIYELAKAKAELPVVMADVEAARKAGPVPVLKSATPSLRQKMSKQFPNRGAQFGAAGFMENLAKVRLQGGGS